MLRIKKLCVNGVGGIQSLNIEFKDGVNIICGANGIGKTTILDSIIAPFTSSMTNIVNLKRNSLVDNGTIEINIEKDSRNDQSLINIKEFDPNLHNRGGSWTDLSKNIISFKTHRDIKYTSVDSIKKDTISSNYEIANKQANDGVSSTDIKQWFVNRYMWSAHKDALTKAQKANFELAKSCFS